MVFEFKKFYSVDKSAEMLELRKKAYQQLRDLLFMAIPDDEMLEKVSYTVRDYCADSYRMGFLAGYDYGKGRENVNN